MTQLRQAGGSVGDTAAFDLTDRGLLLADGVFDTSRIVNGRMILRRAHFARLAGDSGALGIGFDMRWLQELAEAEIPAGGNGALRLTITRGPGGRGLADEAGGDATLLARFTPMDLPLPMPPVRLVASGIRRNETSPTAHHKTLSYTDNIMALREAVAAGYDSALLLNTQGLVACGVAANVFALFGRKLVTPIKADGALPGVVRGWLLDVAGEAGLEASEESLTPEELVQADRLFLTNSLRIFEPVSEFAGRQFETDLPEGLVALGRALLNGDYDGE